MTQIQLEFCKRITISRVHLRHPTNLRLYLRYYL